MALLVSEDEELVSSLTITLGTIKSIEGQNWQEIHLKLTSGLNQIDLGKERAECLLCRQPKDELQTFITALEQVSTGKKESLLFEPSEPCFEFSIIALNNAQEYKIECWLDAGNATTGIYRWDAMGIRFHTVKRHLDSFINQLKKELQPAKIEVS
jgi:hypothetical protein